MLLNLARNYNNKWCTGDFVARRRRSGQPLKHKLVTARRKIGGELDGRGLTGLGRRDREGETGGAGLVLNAKHKRLIRRIIRDVEKEIEGLTGRNLEDGLGGA